MQALPKFSKRVLSAGAPESDEQKPPHTLFAQLFDPGTRAYSIRAAAQAMGVSEVTVKRLITAGKLKSIKVGRRRIVTPHAA